MTEEEIIRSSWDVALRGVKNGRKLSSKIDYCFSCQDLLVLCCLHEANLHRQKIEDLLEDCNFHRENGLLQEGKYDECRQMVINDLIKEV